MDTTNWERAIRRFLTAQTVSLFGSSLVQYAIVWHLTISTSSGRMLTLSTLCGFLPQILISLFAGGWIDRYDRKRAIQMADALIAGSTLALAAALATGQGSSWALLAVLAVRSAGTGVQTPAVHAVTAQLVPRERLMWVGGIQSTLSSATMLLAPAVSGALLSIAPLQAVLLIDVGTAALGIGITATVPIPAYERALGRGTDLFSQLREGASDLRKLTFLPPLLLFQAVVLFLISPSAFLTPLMVSRTFGAEVWRLTASEMTYSLGMVLGGLLIARWGGFRRRLDTTLVAGGVYGLLMVGLGTALDFPLYLLCNTMIGITAPCYNAPITVTLQERVEPGLQGRVFSLMQVTTSCALPLGMVVFGPLADAVAVQRVLVGAGLCVVLVCVAAACARGRVARR